LRALSSPLRTRRPLRTHRSPSLPRVPTENASLAESSPAEPNENAPAEPSEIAPAENAETRAEAAEEEWAAVRG